MFGRYLSKYNDYAPLNGYRDYRKANWNSRAVIVAVLVLASVVLNVVFLVRYWITWPSPLDDYQQL